MHTKTNHNTISYNSMYLKVISKLNLSFHCIIPNANSVQNCGQLVFFCVFFFLFQNPSKGDMCLLIRT